jgi:hypothetical protein
MYARHCQVAPLDVFTYVCDIAHMGPTQVLLSVCALSCERVGKCIWVTRSSALT